MGISICFTHGTFLPLSIQGYYGPFCTFAILCGPFALSMHYIKTVRCKSFHAVKIKQFVKVCLYRELPLHLAKSFSCYFFKKQIHFSIFHIFGNVTGISFGRSC